MLSLCWLRLRMTAVIFSFILKAIKVERGKEFEMVIHTKVWDGFPIPWFRGGFRFGSQVEKIGSSFFVWRSDNLLAALNLSKPSCNLCWRFVIHVLGWQCIVGCYEGSTSQFAVWTKLPIVTSTSTKPSDGYGCTVGATNGTTKDARKCGFILRHSRASTLPPNLE